MRLVLALFCLQWALLGQDVSRASNPRDAMQPDLSGLVYPALARAARVQGIVRFEVKDGAAQLISGHPMLVGPSKSNLEKWASRGAVKDFLVRYSFELFPNTRIANEPIGDPVDRFFLRLFHRPTNRVTTICVNINQKPPRFLISTEDEHLLVLIEINGGAFCQPTETSTATLARL